MASFVFYDLTFLVIFTLLVIIFLYRRRSNLKRQGLLYLYRTKVGIKIMDWTVKKFGKFLKPFEYIVLASGYILMAVMIYLLARFTYIYTKFDVAREIKIPPVLPLFPYATDLFKVDFLPPFYFTYWIIIIAIIAISHEFAHGIFARLHKIKVHSTGFGFLGPFLAAFVEPDEKQMQKASKKNQLSVLAAGTFANVLMTILFGAIMAVFFALSFSPAGINFNVYPQAVINVSLITMVANNSVTETNQIPLFIQEGLNPIVVEGNRYLIPKENLLTAIENGFEEIVVFQDAPAIRNNLKGPILSINEKQITSQEILREELGNYFPGDRISITTLDENGNRVESEISLDEKDGRAYLGVGFSLPSQEGVSGFIYKLVSKIKDPVIYYEPNYDGNFAWFVYNLLWWTVLINISVALINMLPVGIFDGGRFFYLTLWGITGNEKFGKVAFKIATWLILAVLVWVMLVWGFAFF